MTMTAHVGDPIGLVLDNGKPERFYWNERWLITSALPDAFEFLGDDVRVTGWKVTAQTADGSEAAEFDLVRDFSSGGWLIDHVTYG